MRGQLHALALYLGYRPIRTHWIGDWVGLTAGLGLFEKRQMFHLKLKPGSSMT
jgi:hypothetical protein